MSHIPTALKGLLVVSVSYGKQQYGLYRVKQVDARALVISHGAFIFPVGTELDVEDFKYQVANGKSFSQRATVVESDREGIRLAW